MPAQFGAALLDEPDELGDDEDDDGGTILKQSANRISPSNGSSPSGGTQLHNSPPHSSGPPQFRQIQIGEFHTNMHCVFAVHSLLDMLDEPELTDDSVDVDEADVDEVDDIELDDRDELDRLL